MKISKLRLGNSSIVGLDIGSSSVKAVEVIDRGRERGFELKSLGIAALPPEAIVQGAFLDSAAIVEAIREAVEQGGIKSRNVAVGVSGHSVIVKKVNLARQTRTELEDSIQWKTMTQSNQTN